MVLGVLEEQRDVRSSAYAAGQPRGRVADQREDVDLRRTVALQEGVLARFCAEAGSLRRVIRLLRLGLCDVPS